jgi:nicotinate-nucleotide adenylyltransferase
VIGKLDSALRARFAPLDLAITDISASDIRSRVAAGQSIRGLVPDEVARYIERRGLYK